MAEEHRSDSINESLRDPVTIGNPCRCKADFSYSITPTKLIIRDTGKGTKSVLDDLPAVIRRIEHWHQGSIAAFDITIFDPAGNLVKRIEPDSS